MQISILLVRALVNELERRCAPLDRVLPADALPRPLLDDPTARISYDDYHRIVTRALDVTADPQLGLHVGARTPTAGFPLLGPLITASATLRDAANALARYAPLLADGLRWEFRTEGSIAELACEIPPVHAHRAYSSEASLALAAVFLRVLAHGSLADVSFAHAPTGPIDNYRAVFGCEPRFRADRNAIRGDASRLDEKLLNADPAVHALLRTRAESMLAALESPDRLPMRIRAFISGHERPVSVTTAILEAHFAVGGRTLRRRLSAQGVGLRSLLDDALRETACSALSEPGASIKDVSYRLGFADPNAFHRAFKRWTGSTPTDYRATTRRDVDHLGKRHAGDLP